MNHFDKIALALPAAGLDGVLLTGEYNRFYASGFATTGTDGMRQKPRPPVSVRSTPQRRGHRLQIIPSGA